MEFEFNDDQKRVIDAGVRHLLSSSGDPVFQFSGKAGTGKSVVMHEIYKQSGTPLIEIAPMAYVGQAAIVMRLKGFPNAKTIHSWIYHTEIAPKFNKKEQLFQVNDYLGTFDTGLTFTPKPLDNIKYFFIDEGGTVPMSLYPDIVRGDKRIIVAGDINQLPPVRDTPAFLYDPSKVMFLNQVMRQKTGSGILYIADKALASEPFPNAFYGDALVIYEDELSNDLLLGADMILCATNRTRDKYTHIIRNEIKGITSDLPLFGEKVICRKNDWQLEVNGIGLGNGIIGTVANMPEVSSFYDSGKKSDCFLMDFKPDLFDGIFFDLDVNFPYFKADSKLKAKMKSSPYIQGHLFDFAYANTVHLTQGGQYRKVIYIEENVFDRDIQRRLNYTACTRATEQLIYVKKRYRKYY